jgi:predicted enzyme related to lactoylglutathione lyase
MPSPVVHLELHTSNLARACRFYSRLLGWRPEAISTAGRTYHSLDLGPALGGGVVECGTAHALWLPYAEVPDIAAVTERACDLGAAVMLPPREGPLGYRSVVTTPDAGELALWQPKR